MILAAHEQPELGNDYPNGSNSEMPGKPLPVSG